MKSCALLSHAQHSLCNMFSKEENNKIIKLLLTPDPPLDPDEAKEIAQISDADIKDELEKALQDPEEIMRLRRMAENEKLLKSCLNNPEIIIDGKSYDLEKKFQETLAKDLSPSPGLLDKMSQYFGSFFPIKKNLVEEALQVENNKADKLFKPSQAKSD